MTKMINIISNSKKKNYERNTAGWSQRRTWSCPTGNISTARTTGREGRINNNIKKLLKHRRKILLILLKVVLTHHKRRCWNQCSGLKIWQAWGRRRRRMRARLPRTLTRRRREERAWTRAEGGGMSIVLTTTTTPRWTRRITRLRTTSDESEKNARETKEIIIPFFSRFLANNNTPLLIRMRKNVITKEILV